MTVAPTTSTHATTRARIDALGELRFTVPSLPGSYTAAVQRHCLQTHFSVGAKAEGPAQFLQADPAAYRIKGTLATRWACGQSNLAKYMPLRTGCPAASRPSHVTRLVPAGTAPFSNARTRRPCTS